MKQDLDHSIWKHIKQNNLQHKKILVALSGGIDSVALLVSLRKVHSQVYACYFHHGESDVLKQKKYRDEAALFCEKLCKKIGIPFQVLQNSKFAKSELHLRELRYESLHKFMQKHEIDILALGHHRDDLLETRLLRLIRGTGAQGLLAMHPLKQIYFRPLLDVTKKELRSYLSAEKIRYLKDPSNDSMDPMRNWLREKWLKPLERKQKGSLGSLARSLETIAKELEEESLWELLEKNESFLQHCDEKRAISRAFFISLSLNYQKKLLAQYLLSLNKKDFSQSHLEEICKRLDNSQKVFTFKVAALNWEINAEQIKVQPS